MISLTVILSLARVSGRTQKRMAYWPAPKTLTWPIPGTRVIASAPTYVAQSWTCGGAMLGNCAIGSRTSAAVPTMTVRMAITMATTGRLTKNFAIVRCSLSALGATGRAGYRLRGGGLRRGRLRIHRHAGFDFLHAFNHDPFARLEPLRDDPH